MAVECLYARVALRESFRRSAEQLTGWRFNGAGGPLTGRRDGGRVNGHGQGRRHSEGHTGPEDGRTVRGKRKAPPERSGAVR